MCLMLVNKSFHTPLLCKRTGVNEFITLLRAKVQTLPSIFNCMWQRWFPLLSHLGKVRSFPVPILSSPIELKKICYHCWLSGECEGKTSCFCFCFSSRMACFFFFYKAESENSTSWGWFQLKFHCLDPPFVSLSYENNYRQRNWHEFGCDSLTRTFSWGHF